MRKFELSDIVYHITDEMQRPGIVTGVVQRPGCTTYLVSFGVELGEKDCLETELVSDKQYKIM